MEDLGTRLGGDMSRTVNYQDISLVCGSQWGESFDGYEGEIFIRELKVNFCVCGFFIITIVFRRQPRSQGISM